MRGIAVSSFMLNWEKDSAFEAKHSVQLCSCRGQKVRPSGPSLEENLALLIEMTFGEE